MSDRFALPLLALLALGLIALALVWPQGLGRRSPGPFGHHPTPGVRPSTPAKAPGAASGRLRSDPPATATQR